MNRGRSSLILQSSRADMPKELTHWILADRALAGLSDDSRLRGLIQEHHDCYLGGAVLPDTLLHHVRGPHAATALALARQFHDTAGNSFAPLILAEQRFPDGLPPAILACLLGVITHMQADIVFHPFVYALTGTTGIGRHYRLETDMDVHFLQWRSHSLPCDMWPTWSRRPPDRSSSIPAPCSSTLSSRLPRQALEQALKHHCRFQGMYDRTFWKLAVRLASLLAGAPYSEQRHLFYPLPGTGRVTASVNDTVEWRHPVSGEPRRTSLEQLADDTVQRCTTLFERMETAGSLADGPQ